MKITKDLFVWKVITHKQASDIFHLGIFDVFKLNEDGSESIIESEEELLEAYYEKAVIGIEVGKIDYLQANTIILNLDEKIGKE